MKTKDINFFKDQKVRDNYIRGMAKALNILSETLNKFVEVVNKIDWEKLNKKEVKKIE